MSIASTPAIPPRVSGDGALRIAQADTENVYRDLTNYRIALALEPDGWHVDYQLKSPTAHVAGPTIASRA